MNDVELALIVGVFKDAAAFNTKKLRDRLQRKVNRRIHILVDELPGNAAE